MVFGLVEATLEFVCRVKSLRQHMVATGTRNNYLQENGFTMFSLLFLFFLVVFLHGFSRHPDFEEVILQ